MDNPGPAALVLGDRVAWIMRRMGNADGVSAIHRVFENGRTFCNHDVPDADRRLPLLKSLNVCSRCERMYQRVVEAKATPAERTRMASGW